MKLIDFEKQLITEKELSKLYTFNTNQLGLEKYHCRKYIDYDLLNELIDELSTYDTIYLELADEVQLVKTLYEKCLSYFIKYNQAVNNLEMYFHYNGVFFKICFNGYLNNEMNNIMMIKVNESDFENFFDLSSKYTSFNSLMDVIISYQQMINNALDIYKDNITYKPNRYSFEKIVEVDSTDKYDENYSFTKYEMNQIRDWQKKHREKNHPEGDTYQGAIGVERFKYDLASTSIGMIKRCYCETCQEKYEQESKQYTTEDFLKNISMTSKELKKDSSYRNKMLKELKDKWDYECDFSTLG